MRVSGVVMGAPNPRLLAAFYERLLGWTVVGEAGPRPGAPPEDGWAQLRPPSGVTGVSLAFEFEPDYVPPVWPSAPGEPQIMTHIDIAVEDVEEAVAWAVDAGATLAEYQPQELVRVMFDPAGHPFCIFPGQV
jgi:catechol 2,3-dioxygenase-like lactoylglutathione lyase family enzyme